MAFTRAWNEAFPADTQAANLLGQDIRDLKQDVRERVAAISGTFANRPAVGDMVTAWGAFGGNGVLYFATDTGAIYQWNGAAWVDVTVTIGSSRIPTVGGSIIAPAAAIDITQIWRAPYACTATQIIAYCPDGDVTINALHNAATLHAANIVVTAGGGFSVTAVNQNAAVALGDSLGIRLVSIDAGTPSYVFIQIDLTRP